ncbi:Dor1-like family-domain-containing protein [Dendryphion nanum]|uniref:Conserved oligomeric Golgi complex subunit 8 n=1 Tax=Dendryphion nanum TaxID=256645 RepID=A0A9P9E406_9PLEO|nr:Dor1-like family-domain-containing protein [Dendryphion nanum]
MADPLFDLLIPYFDAQDDSTLSSSPSTIPSSASSAADYDPITTTAYLARLTTLPLAALTSSEQQSLAQGSQSALRSLQSLSKRSYKPIIASADHLAHLAHDLPALAHDARSLHAALPSVETASHRFADRYTGKQADNPVLHRRRKAMLLANNIDRVSDVLDLPSLLSSAIASSSTTTTANAPNTSSSSYSAYSSSSQTSATVPSPATNANYASALDLHAHIKRLSTLYPNSNLVSSLATQAEQEMKTMTTNLITSLQHPSIKLAGAMRTIGWLRRVAPELDESWSADQARMGSGEGSLGALFLVCRLRCLESMLSALDPLRELADQETELRSKSGSATTSWGQQTERYLKRYIETFREQSFAIISMYKDIFPSALPPPPAADTAAPPVQPLTGLQHNSLQPIPSALATFPLHLADLLFDTLRTYLPNVQDKSSRDSLLTQVLYCASSLGRRGADFSIMIALLEEDLQTALAHDHPEDEDLHEEWVDVMKKHRLQASRLELLASGVGAGRTSSPVDRAISPAR